MVIFRVVQLRTAGLVAGWLELPRALHVHGVHTVRRVIHIEFRMHVRERVQFCNAPTVGVSRVSLRLATKHASVVAAVCLVTAAERAGGQSQVERVGHGSDSACVEIPR